MHNVYSSIHSRDVGHCNNGIAQTIAYFMLRRFRMQSKNFDEMTERFTEKFVRSWKPCVFNMQGIVTWAKGKNSCLREKVFVHWLSFQETSLRTNGLSLETFFFYRINNNYRNFTEINCDDVFNTHCSKSVHVTRKRESTRLDKEAKNTNVRSG